MAEGSAKEEGSPRAESGAKAERCVGGDAITGGSVAIERGSAMAQRLDPGAAVITAHGRPHVVVIGGGFGGVAAARALARTPVDVTLIDRRNHLLFQPLLYQVATGSLDSGEIAEPLRGIFHRTRNVNVVLGHVDRIDPQSRRVWMRGGDATSSEPRPLGYEYLILASGSGGSYFGHDEFAQYAPGLKSLEDALEIRRRVLLTFELADQETDPEIQRELMTFVVVGGGPTGVELAGALADLVQRSPVGEYRHIRQCEARFVLVEGGPRVLPSYPPDLSSSAERQLRDLGVEVRSNAFVTKLDDRYVRIGNDCIAARTVLWAAGVSASALARQLGAPLDHHGRVEVAPDLRPPGSHCVFVIGDLASLTSRGAPIPGVAPAAMQEGRHAAKNIARLVAGRDTVPFKYWNKGTISTIGRRRAVADLGWIRLSGALAWFAYLGVHLFYLVGFRRRLVVLIDWAWSYFSRSRSARVLTDTAENERNRDHAHADQKLPIHA